MKRKIAVIGSRGYPYVYSGYETFVKETFELLTEKYECHIYCHKYLFSERPKEVNGLKLHYIPTVNHKVLAQLSNSFLSTLHALIFHRFDVILYVNTANGPFALLTKIFRVKTAMITDGLEWKRPKWEGAGAKYFFWSSRISTKLIDVLISDSAAMRDIYLEQFNVDSKVIEYGANLPKRTTGSDSIKEYGLRKNDYYLIVGRLIPDNNADLILEGFTRSKSGKKLVIVGDVPYQDAYSKKIKTLASDNVIFTGYVKDQDTLKELYFNSYAYLHGHEYGGTNPTLLKALAYGCCILALDTPFSREVLVDGEFGAFFEKKSESVTDQIDYLDAKPDLVNSYKEKSSLPISEKYNWDRIADLYDSLFTEMSKGR